MLKFFEKEKGEVLDSHTLLWKKCEMFHSSSTPAADQNCQISSIVIVEAVENVLYPMRGESNEVLYVLKDYLDPAALLEPGSPNATVVERFGFDAFGPVRFMTEAFGSRGNSEYDWNFLFHAEFMDQESGLYNYGYRYLHTSLGRWLSRDPSDDDGNSVNT